MRSVSLRADATTIQALGYEIELKRQRLHDIHLPTGHLVACDPLSMPETEPFETKLPTGMFPVYATTARLRDQERLSMLTIEFSDAEPVRFELMAVPGEETDWAPGQRPGFTVDTSFAALMDEATANLLMSIDGFEDEIEEFEKTLESKLRKSRKKGALPFANIELGKHRNMIAVTIDPGSYTTYIGRDDDDQIVQLLVDFQAVDFRISPSGIVF